MYSKGRAYLQRYQAFFTEVKQIFTRRMLNSDHSKKGESKHIENRPDVLLSHIHLPSIFPNVSSPNGLPYQSLTPCKKIARIARREPEAYARCERVSLVSSFVTSLLAGKYCPIDASDASGMNLMDIRRVMEGLKKIREGPLNTKSIIFPTPFLWPTSVLCGALSCFVRGRSSAVREFSLTMRLP